VDNEQISANQLSKGQNLQREMNYILYLLEYKKSLEFLSRGLIIARV